MVREATYTARITLLYDPDEQSAFDALCDYQAENNILESLSLESDELFEES